MKMRYWKAVLIACVIAALSGCSQNTEESKSSGSEGIKPAPAHNPAAEAMPASAGGLKFTAPAGWTSETPTSSMRQAQYRLPKVEGDSEDAELVVFYFQGGGGGVQANVDRWIGQFSKADGSPASDVAKTTTKTVNGVPLTIVDVTGTYDSGMGPMQTEATPRSNYRMLAVVAEASGGPWFFKLTGPTKTVTKWQPSFDAFLDSITPEN
jgi:hypothetical protein